MEQPPHPILTDVTLQLREPTDIGRLSMIELACSNENTTPKQLKNKQNKTIKEK